MKQTTSKRIASLLVCFLLVQTIFMGLDLIFEVVPRAGGITITVDDSGGADYLRIQDAVDNASDGDTVYVYSGIYYEHVLMHGKEYFTLEGQNRDTTIIDGSGTGVGIHFETSYHGVIKKFTIRNALEGIIIHGENCIITNNRIQNMTLEGIGVPWVFNLVSNNIINNSIVGIHTLAANTLKENTINNCDIGIEIFDNDNFIYNNVINAIRVGLKFESPYYTHSYITQNNTVNGETIYHFYDIHGTPGSPIIIDNLVLDNSNISNIGKISLVDCSYIEVKNNVLSNNFPGSGIFVYSSHNITIEGNSIDNNTGYIFIFDGAGVQMFGSNDIMISNNTIFNNDEGIYCGMGRDELFNDEFSNYITIKDNNISYNNENGIYLRDRVYNGEIENNYISNNSLGILFSGWGGTYNVRYFNIMNNTLIGNPVGMHLNYAWNNTIANNKIVSCADVGVKSRYYSRYNVFSNNTIESDGYGFEFDRDSYNTYVNNTIVGDLYDIYFSGSSASQVTFLNCSFNKSKVYYSNQISTLTVEWYLDVNVTNPLGQLLPDTPVCVKDSKNSPPPQRYKTDPEGYVLWLVETEYVERDTDGDTIGERDYYTPHTITAWNETNTGFTETNMSQSKKENVVLDDVAAFNLSLKKGWNLISLPLVQSDTSISTVLSSIAGNYNIVQWFNASEGKWHTTDDDLTDLDHTMGFWIHMKSDDSLVVTGDIPNTTSIPLYKGWNLVGNPKFCIYDFDDIFASITGNYTAVQWYDASDNNDPWKHYNPNKPSDLNDLTYITNCRGYWIHVNEDSVWEVNNL